VCLKCKTKDLSRLKIRQLCFWQSVKRYRSSRARG
jgi:hypothetical protein